MAFGLCFLTFLCLNLIVWFCFSGLKHLALGFLGYLPLVPLVHLSFCPGPLMFLEIRIVWIVGFGLWIEYIFLLCSFASRRDKTGCVDRCVDLCFLSAHSSEHAAVGGCHLVVTTLQSVYSDFPTFVCNDFKQITYREASCSGPTYQISRCF